MNPMEAAGLFRPAAQPVALPHELGQLQWMRHRTGGLPLSAL